MAYADQKQNKSVAIGSVVLVHAALGAALLSGLAVRFVTPERTTLTTKNIPIDEPPPIPKPEPLAPRVETPAARPDTLTVPVPRVSTASDPVMPTTTMIYPLPLPSLPPAPEPLPRAEPPAPAAVNLSRGLQPRGDQGRWFPQDSYPAAARRAGAEGRVSVSVDVGATGRVTACRVTSTSGNEDLDLATCRLATRNGRFEPARNEAGEPVASTTALRNVRWRLEE